MFYAKPETVGFFPDLAGLSLVSLLVRITQELVLADFYPPDYAVT